MALNELRFLHGTASCDSFENTSLLPVGNSYFLLCVIISACLFSIN